MINSCTKFLDQSIKATDAVQTVTQKLLKFTKLSNFGHLDDFQAIWAWYTHIDTLLNTKKGEIFLAVLFYNAFSTVP